jgi:peptidyl-prolyl cis-trans isomerase SurA
MLTSSRPGYESVPAGDVEDAFAERRRSVPDDVFQQQLDERGLTVENMKLGIRRELTVQKLLEQEVEARIVVTDADISAYFNEHKDQFNLTEPHFRLAQISVTPVVDPQLRNRMNSDASTPAEALEKAQMLMERLRAGGDFGELALDYSEDLGTVAQGGDVGFVPQSALAQVSPPFRNAVETMEPGEVRLVSAGGAHTILLLVARQPAGQRDLDSPDVRDGIRERLRTIQRQLLEAAYAAAVLDEADVTNYLARQIVVNGGVVPPGADR